jgi:hypothetical protein
MQAQETRSPFLRSWGSLHPWKCVRTFVYAFEPSTQLFWLKVRNIGCLRSLLFGPSAYLPDAGMAVYHAACAAALAREILVDLYTFFRPPAPYQQLFVLTASQAVSRP